MTLLHGNCAQSLGESAFSHTGPVASMVFTHICWLVWSFVGCPWRAIIHSVTLYACLSEAITKIWTYYQRRKCSAETLVCDDIRVMRIFVGVRWIVGIKWEWGPRKLPFLFIAVGMSFEISYMKPKLLCLSMYSSIAFHRHWNIWPWMTLNSHIALNTVFRVESFSVDALVLRHDCFKIDGDAHTLSVTKM